MPIFHLVCDLQLFNQQLTCILWSTEFRNEIITKITIIHSQCSLQSFHQSRLCIHESDNGEQNHWKMIIHFSRHFRFADQDITFTILSMRNGNKTCVNIILMLCDLQVDDNLESLSFQSIMVPNRTLVKVVYVQCNLPSNNCAEILIS